MSRAAAAGPTVEPLLYGVHASGGGSSSTSVQAGQLYRLSVPRAFSSPAAGRAVRVSLAPAAVDTQPGGWYPGWSTANTDRRAAPAGSVDDVPIEELGVGIIVVATAGNCNINRTVQAEPQTAADIRIGPDGSALDLIRFQITSAEHYDGRPLALVGTSADGRPLPGADGMCIRVEAPAGGKRAISGQELRSGGFLGVAKRLREVPPPLTPPLPPPGTPPPPGLFDSEALTAAALKVEPPDTPLSTPASTPSSDSGPASPQSEPASPPQSAPTPPPPQSLPLSSPPPPPSDSDLEIERELEALRIAKHIAGEDEHAEIKPQELVPLVNAIGERKDVIRNIVRRTMDELVLRGQRSGINHPSLASLTRLAKLLSRLDAAGLDNPTPPPPSHTLFAMDVLEQPDIARWGEPLPGWFPPPDYGEKYVAAVEQAFDAIKRTAAGPSFVIAVNAAAACFTDDRLILSPFIRTFSGRIRFRALLVILRETAASMAPVIRVANHLTMAALRRLSWRSEDREDAIRSAWDAIDALRPVMRNAPPDLYPISITRALEVLKLAAEAAKNLSSESSSAAATVGPLRMLYAEAVARIGEQEAMAGLLQDGIEHLFEAWALLLRAGGSPSRLESRIILNLTDAHLVSPTACQLAERVYWCRESDEDMHIEARACCVLAQLSGAAGRAEEAKQYADRVFEIVESMPAEQREYAPAAFAAASIALMACVRTGRMDECFSYARLAMKERSKHPDGAHPALDSSSGGFRLFKGPALDACLEMFRFALFLYALSDPHKMTSLSDCLGAMGEVYAKQGQWRRAAMCFAESLEWIKRFRKALPSDHPRVIRISAALKRCEKQARLAAAAGSPPRAGDAG